MSKEYSQQQITQFFQQFKKLENSYPIEKVHQIINNPNAMARYKVKHVKPLKFIIMTFLISLTVVLALWFSSPGTNQENTNLQDPLVVANKPAKPQNINSPNEQRKDAKLALTATTNGDDGIDKSQSIAIEQTKTKDELAFSDSVIDASKFILELTNEELEKLGFQINHYAVYYRNHYNDQKVFYLSEHSNGRFILDRAGVLNAMKDYYPLQTDTIPLGGTLKYMETTMKSMAYSPKIREDIEYVKSRNSFYPLFNTNQTGEIEKVNSDLTFETLADTLMPVVIKCSQLDLERKNDQFFWFITNNDFYSKLPERYAWVKDEFERLKSAKRANGNKLNIDFKLKDWNKELLISANVVLDGKGNIVQFTKEELKKVGVFFNSYNFGEYSIHTPYQGSSAGGKMEIINGRPEMKFDTIFNTDYFIKYITDCTGDFPFTGTTIKRMDEFFNDDDILLPVQAENKEGTIYWFTLSENFWKLVPSRYQYLKVHYEKMLYNKSIDTNRDFVKYFTDPFKKVGVDVSVIELSKEELEKIGFKYENGGAEINCGFGKNWIQFKFEDIYAKMDDKRRAMSITKMPPFENVGYITNGTNRFIKEEWIGKFDSLYAASNQGYQFVYITDSLGRHMHRIYIDQKDIQINGEDFKYLIPVMVRNSKVANPLSEDRVFWFTPTEAFFDRLPDRIKKEIKEEYEIVSSEGKSTELSACTYFESCKSTLKVESMKIYPNPAQQEITIDIKLESPLEGEISIANIAGQEIKILKSQSIFDKGFNSVKCELIGIKPGIYLVSLITKSGYKTERIIVSE